MVAVFFFLALFLAVRGFFYFRNGRAIAGTLAGLGCLLFAGAIYVDYVRFTKGPATQGGGTEIAEAEALPEQAAVQESEEEPDKTRDAASAGGDDMGVDPFDAGA